MLLKNGELVKISVHNLLVLNTKMPLRMYFIIYMNVKSTNLVCGQLNAKKLNAGSVFSFFSFPFKEINFESNLFFSSYLYSEKEKLRGCFERITNVS